MKADKHADTLEHLHDRGAIEKMQELVKHNNVCLFTSDLTMIPLQTRPMITQEVDEEGNSWFLSSEESNKNLEIGADPRVQLFYANKSDSEYLSVYGHAVVLRDHDTKAEHWNPIAKAWFKEGKNDPDLTVIKVIPEQAYYWDTKN